MAVQIRGVQIQNESIEAGKINLSGSFDFRAASGVQFATKAEADNSTSPATTAYVHTIVTGSLIDGFQGGDGISIDTATSPDTLAVDLASNKGLEFATGELQIKLDGSSLALGAGGISLADGGVANAKIADGAINNAKIASDAAIAQSKLSLDIVNANINASAAIAQSKLALDITNSEINASAAIAISKLAARSISGKDLGTNLDSLTDGNGIADFTYNGSGAATVAIDLDGSTLAVGANGVKISDGGVDGAQLANLAVATAKIADAAVSTAKIANLAVTAGKIGNGEVGYAQINFESNSDNYSPNGSTLSFALTAEVDDAMIAMVLAFKNGLLQKQVQSSPSGADEYTVSTTDGTTTLTFGANLSASDTLEVRYLANKSA